MPIIASETKYLEGYQMGRLKQTSNNGPGKLAFRAFTGFLISSMALALLTSCRAQPVQANPLTLEQALTSTPISALAPSNTYLPTFTPADTLTNTPTSTFVPTYTPTRTPTRTPSWYSVPWAEALSASADSFIRTNPDDALALVQSFDYVNELPGGIPQESPDNTCGPLGVSILLEAGIFYPLDAQIDLHDWWEPNPRWGQPWGMLDMSHYELYQFLTTTKDGIIGNQVTRRNIPGDLNNAVQRFDFTAFPLCPGDWMYTSSVGNGFDHLWAISEVKDGRVYAVGNIPEPGSDRFIIAKILIYDPSDPTVGGVKLNFENHNHGTSGRAGFYLLRPKGGCQTPPGYEGNRVNP
jgi:hypothetical protein